MDTSRKNILITGASGQLGMEFRDLEPGYPSYHFIFAERSTLDITDTAAVENFFATHQLFACINCAAYTLVDKAETEKEQALAANATSPGVLAKAAAKTNTKFIHFSTDYVFNGNGTSPYKPGDATDPVNFYGETKLRGEQLVLAANPQSIIIRTSWVYSRHGKNFVKTMLRLLQEKPEISVVADQFGCPTYAADLAKAVLELLEAPAVPVGILHYCNSGIISWHEFASAIRDIKGLDTPVHGIPTAAYPTPAKRPAYSALDTSGIQSYLRSPIPAWHDSLVTCLSGI